MNNKTNYIIKHVEYKLDPDTGIDIESKDYIISKSNNAIYSVNDGPFSAKGFFVLDSNVRTNENDIVAEYIISTNIKEHQWDKYPTIAKFWQESIEIAKTSKSHFDEYSDDDLQEIQRKVTEFARKN